MTVTNNPKPRPKVNFRQGSRKYNRMMDTKRGGPWTLEKIDRAFDSGQEFGTSNFKNDNPATRYVDPQTGDWVVVDDIIGDIIQFGNRNMIPTDLPSGPP